MPEILYATDSTVYEDVSDILHLGLLGIDWTGIGPSIGINVYIGHCHANLTFNALTFKLTAAEQTHVGQKSSPTGPIINHAIQVELRIHTAVAGRYNDGEKFWRLANSISNWLAKHNKLADYLHIIEPGQIQDDLTFEESDTVGGNIIFTVLYTTAHEAA